MLNCIDNSGATVVECIANMKMKRHARIGTGLSRQGDFISELRLHR